MRHRSTDRRGKKFERDVKLNGRLFFASRRFARHTKIVGSCLPRRWSPSPLVLPTIHYAGRDDPPTTFQRSINLDIEHCKKMIRSRCFWCPGISSKRWKYSTRSGIFNIGNLTERKLSSPFLNIKHMLYTSELKHLPIIFIFLFRIKRQRNESSVACKCMKQIGGEDFV